MRNKSFDEEEIGGEYALIRYREGRGSLYSDHRGPGEILLRKLTVPYIHTYIYICSTIFCWPVHHIHARTCCLYDSLNPIISLNNREVFVINDSEGRGEARRG